MSLADFMAGAERNSLKTSRRMHHSWNLLGSIDSLFSDAHNAASTGEPSEGWLQGVFLARSHSAFRAAIRLSTSGQLPEAYMVMRGCLEFALYARYVAEHPDSVGVWVTRSSSAAGRKATRNRFTTRNIFNVVAKHLPKNAPVLERMYDRLVSMGGHPNDLGVRATMTASHEGEDTYLDVHQIALDPVHHPQCVEMNARVGLASLLIFGSIFKNAFRSAGIPEELVRLGSLKSPDWVRSKRRHGTWESSTK